MKDTRRGVCKVLRYAAIGFLILLLLLSVTPYLFPLSPGGSGPARPFEESAFALIEGIDIHYRLWKPEEVSGKLLLIHGLGGSTFSWRYNVKPLEDAGYVVAAVDLPGFGYSSRQKGIDHSQQARAKIMWQLLEHLDMSLEQEAASLRWQLTGHSMGGGTIAAMALENPSRVDSLAFVAGAVYGRPAGGFSHILRFPPAARWLKVAAHYYLLSPERIEQFLSSAYGEEPGAAAVEGYLKPLTLPGTVDTLIDMTLTSKALTEEDIRSICAPALLVWGEHDTWVPVESGIKLAESLQHGELVVMPGTGHCPMETKVAEFNGLLLDFFIRTRHRID